jgi:hypothetical protein
MKKIYLVLSIVFLAGVFVFLAFRFMPAKYITGLLGNDNTVSSLACSYPVKVAGDSMEPYFTSGQMAIFNKCFTIEDLVADKVIAFTDGNVVRLGVIDTIKNLADENVYKVSQPNRQDRMSDVLFGQIMAVYEKEFDQQAPVETEGQSLEIDTVHYSLVLPSGWQTAKEDDEQSIFVNAGEVVVNNFRTYLSISKDQIQGNTSADYINYLKNQIEQSAPDIQFNNENNFIKDGRDAFAMDSYVRQNNTDFKILTVAVRGNGDDVWVLNFNSLANKWEENAPVFENILNSFQVK